MKIEFNKVTWYSKLAAVILFLLVIPVLTFYIGMKYEETAMIWASVNTNTTPIVIKEGGVSSNFSLDSLNGTYNLDDMTVNLVNGKSEEQGTGGDTSQIETAVFGEPVLADLNGDGQKDAIFFISQETEGTGIFFYVVSAINTNGKYIPTNAIFLGDRIAPQNIRVVDGIADVNYAVRKDTDPMTADPSVGVAKYLQIKNGALVEVKK